MTDGAGWFADPSGKINTYRWWDGGAWTRWLSADPAAAVPGPAPPEANEAREAREAPMDDPTAYAPPDPADRVVRLPTAAAILVVSMVLAVIAVGAIISLTADRPLTGPAVAPPPRTANLATVAYDPATRRLSIAELKVTAPAAPFTCDPAPGPVPNVFTSGHRCYAVVHRDYDKAGHDWGAGTGVGVLADPLSGAGGGDLSKIAQATFATLVTNTYDADDITVKKRKTQRLTGLAPDGTAVLVSANLYHHDKGLPTTYDRMLVVVFRLASGQHAAWFARRPNDSPKDVTKTLEASASTIRAWK